MHASDAAARDFRSDVVVSANGSKGFAEVNIPPELMHELGWLLTSLQNYVDGKRLTHWTQTKQEGGHATPWWVYVRLDPRRRAQSIVHFGETTHAVVNATPHLWIQGRAKYIGLGHTLIKRFMRWRRASLLEQYEAVVIADWDATDFGEEYLSLRAGSVMENIPAPPRIQPEGWAYGKAGTKYGWYPPHYVKRR